MSVYFIKIFCLLPFLVVSVISDTKTETISCSSNPFVTSCSSLTLNPRWISSELGGGAFLPENSIPARGRRDKLFRRYHYLQYISLVFNKLKREYARYD